MYDELKNLIQDSRNIVFFGGAGVSTESNIPDFRSESGLYHAQKSYGYSPETMLSHDFFYGNTETFYRYYKENLIYRDAMPNSAHIGLAKLEETGKLKAVITQNIDDLHQMAGNKNVLELHGSLKRWYCLSCGKTSNKNFSCDCGGIVRPDVTLYGENLNQDVVNEAIYQIEQADTLIVAGTSLTVYPAAYYLRYFRGKNLVIINNESTQYDGEASLVLKTNFADTMEKVLNIIKK